MQIVVQALLDPIMGVEDAQAVGEVTGSVRSEQSTPRGQADTPRTPRTHMSSSSVPRSPSSVSGSLSPAAGLFRQLQRGYSFGSETSGESYRPGAGSQSDYSSSGSSAAPSMSPIHQPFFPGPGIAEGVEQPISNGGRGGTNRKTRKYRTNRRSKSRPRSRSKTGGNRNRNTRKNTDVSRTKTKTKTKTMKIKSKKFPKRIYLYSTPRTAQRMAYKYLGRIKTAKLYPARNPAKKYMIFDPKNNKWVNFGQMGYEDYTKHHDKTRRKNYLTRTKGMLGDWKNNKYSANNLSRSILW
jgi:hypothetical protein